MLIGAQGAMIVITLYFVSQSVDGWAADHRRADVTFTTVTLLCRGHRARTQSDY